MSDGYLDLDWFFSHEYLVLRELGLEKLKIRWGIRAMRFDEKIREKGEDNSKKCWAEKKSMEKKELYSRKREKYYKRNDG